MGRTVERSVKPISIELSQSEAELRDPKAYPVKVCPLHFSGSPDGHACAEFAPNQVHLKRFNTTDEQSSTEIVNARFVVGADGQWSRFITLL